MVSPCQRIHQASREPRESTGFSRPSGACANLQKAKTSNCGGGKVDCIISQHSLAIWQEVPLAQLQEIRPLNRSVDRLKATLEDTGVTDALQNQQEAPPSRASLMPTQSPAVIKWQANAT